jgi:excinuclease UvrABC nuclease subunit
MFCIYVFSDENSIPKYVGKAKCFNTRVKKIKKFKEFLWDYK